MNAALGLLALVGCVAATPAAILVGQDDGQWHPEADGSGAGSGLLRWGIDDGSWKPDLDGSWLGRGDLAWLNRRKREANPNSLSQPADEPAVAHAKNAQLRQQYTEGQRNINGGFPSDLPADTPEVAAGKQAHAIAHQNQKLATSGARYATPVHQVTSISTPVAARYATQVATPLEARYATHFVAPVAARYATHFAAPYAHYADARYITPVAHVATPVAHFASPVTHVTTVARSLTPYTHIATPANHVATQIVSPYQYAYNPIVQVYKK